MHREMDTFIGQLRPSRIGALWRQARLLARRARQGRQEELRLNLASDSPQDFVTWTGPSLLLARFFGYTVTIHLTPVDVELYLRAIGSLGRAVLGLAHEVTAPSVRMCHKLAAFDISAVLREATVDVQGVTARAIGDIQPRLLVYSSPAWPQDIAVIVSAFEQIQRKYPRAELTLAGPDPILAGLQTAPILRDRLHICQPCADSAFVQLCQKHDVFLATSRSDITPPQVVVAMASGLPAIMPPLGDIRPATELALLRSGAERRFVRSRIVETVLALIENRSLAQAMSDYSRQCRTAPPESSALPPSWRLTG